MLKGKQVWRAPRERANAIGDSTFPNQTIQSNNGDRKSTVSVVAKQTSGIYNHTDGIRGRIVKIRVRRDIC